MREILGEVQNIRNLLVDAHHAIDHYQREYKRRPKHVAELIHDIEVKFLESYEEVEERTAVADYGRCYLLDDLEQKNQLADLIFSQQVFYRQLAEELSSLEWLPKEVAV